MSCARGGGRGGSPRCRPLVGRRKCGQRRRSVPVRDALRGQGKVVRYPQHSRSSTSYVPESPPRARRGAGYWREAGAESVVIPAKLGLEKGTWFPILVGVRGLLVQD